MDLFYLNYLYYIVGMIKSFQKSGWMVSCRIR